MARICEPVEEEEEGVITVSLSNNVTELSVMETILHQTKNYDSTNSK